MKNTATIKSLVIATLLIGTTGFAQEHAKSERKKGPNPTQIMERMDTDKNGTISKTEAKAADDKRAKKGKEVKPKKSLYTHFEIADVDKNGEISLEELKEDLKRNKPSAGNFIKEFDTNGDNKLNKTETLAAKKKHIEQMDKRSEEKEKKILSTRFTEVDLDGNSILSLSEINSDVAQMPAPRNPERKKPTGDQIFKKLDIDKDGSVSKAEVIAHDKKKREKAEERKKCNIYDTFETVDTNNDGFLTADELKAYKELTKKGRKC